MSLIRPVVVTTADPSVSSFPSGSPPCPHLQQQQQQVQLTWTETGMEKLCAQSEINKPICV